ncbi:hypothetical protein [Vibrio sonorensis]|uniref:hypothetical protein n=1 Tax=Vibrio sonorensis TaxID=1004316 RepID=UPI0008DAD6BB|nr:hypothetical protein [Vibrio sonorensis]
MRLYKLFVLIVMSVFPTMSYALTQSELNAKICQYVPTVAQTNAYSNGVVYDGRLLLSGNSKNVIRVPKDGQALSFLSNEGEFQCEYPTDPKQDCLVDRTITYPGFPFNLPELSDRGNDYECSKSACSISAGYYKDLKIAKNQAVLTLGSGVYYVNELNFDAVGARLEVEGPVEIHFNKIFFKENNIKLNMNNTPNNLLLLGHGEDSFVRLDDVNNVIVNGFIYISDEATNQGASPLKVTRILLPAE